MLEFLKNKVIPLALWNIFQSLQVKIQTKKIKSWNLGW